MRPHFCLSSTQFKSDLDLRSPELGSTADEKAECCAMVNTCLSATILWDGSKETNPQSLFLNLAHDLSGVR